MKPSGFEGETTMIFLLDNHDSFTYNLYQYFGELGEDIIVKRQDAITITDIEAMHPDLIVISPGPCTPNESPLSLAIIEHFMGQIPILGVSLGSSPFLEATAYPDHLELFWANRSHWEIIPLQKFESLKFLNDSQSKYHVLHSPFPFSGGAVGFLSYDLKNELELLPNGAEEGLWLNTKGYISEGTMSNLFFIKDETLFTPSLASGCLPGTRRQLTLDLAWSLQIPTCEGLYPFSTLLLADEIFMTNALMGIMPVRQVDDFPFPIAQLSTKKSVMRRLELAYNNIIKNASPPLS